MFFILLYLRFLVLYTHFIGSIICKYAIQPSGCIVLVIKVSIYLQGFRYFAKKKSKFSRDFQGQIRGKNGRFRGENSQNLRKIGRFRGILTERSQISKDFQGQILRKIGRFHGKFQRETSPRNNQ